MQYPYTQNKKVIIAVDAMGGDFAPENQVYGAISAANEKKDSIEIILTGDEKSINSVKLVNIIKILSFDNDLSIDRKTKR